MNSVTATATRPVLLGINHDGPVYVQGLGSNAGLDWTVQPEDFGNLVDHVNKYGGPDFFSIIPLSE